MKFTIIRSRLLDAVKTVQNIVAGKASVQILQNVRVVAEDGRLELTTTDLTITVKHSVECSVDVPGKTTIPVRLLFLTMSKAAEGPVTIETGDDNLSVISAGSAVFKIAGLPEKEYPQTVAEDDSFCYTIPQSTLREMLRKTHYAATQEEQRRNIQGVLMSFRAGKLTMVATDGRRLALVDNEVEIPAGGERDVTIPNRSITELMRILEAGDGKEAKIYLRNTQAYFDLGETGFSTKILSDPYPDYKPVIPGSLAEHAEIDRQLLIEALERTSVMFFAKKNAAHLVFADNQLIVSSNSSDLGEARDIIPIKFSGSRIEVCVDPVFLIEPLKAIDDNEVTIELNDGISPFVLKCGIPFIYVLMPLRIM